MSYILDALRKAERERARGAVPAPAHGAGAEASRWPLILALFVALNGAAWLGVGWYGQRERVPQAAPPPPAGAPLPEPAPVPVAEPVAPAAPAAEPPSPIEAGPAPAAQAASAVPPAPPPRRRAGPISEQIPAGLPALELGVHVYSERPSARFVLINSRRYGEGEALREGPRVESIGPEGVVLSHAGRRFLVRLPR